jgi:hypothetical protein
MFTYCSTVRLPMLSGMEPVRWLLFRYRYLQVQLHIETRRNIARVSSSVIIVTAL